jgi:hypothetical protein
LQSICSPKILPQSAHLISSSTSGLRFTLSWKSLVLASAAALWIVGIGAGIRQVYLFETTAGAVGSTPLTWPGSSGVVRSPGRSTVVMLMHPQCSCSSASLAELREIMARAHEPTVAWVLFVQSAATPESSTWREAERIPGVRVAVDPRGAEAARFGALTSGHTVVYDAAGRLRFAGGITGARGHGGESMARHLVLAALDDPPAATERPGEKLRPWETLRHWVFGCPLDDDAGLGA